MNTIILLIQRSKNWKYVLALTFNEFSVILFLKYLYFSIAEQNVQKLKIGENNIRRISSFTDGHESIWKNHLSFQE